MNQVAAQRRRYRIQPREVAVLEGATVSAGEQAEQQEIHVEVEVVLQRDQGRRDAIAAVDR